MNNFGSHNRHAGDRCSDIRVEVVEGGDPTRAQAAALAIALLTTSTQDRRPVATLTGWQQAALAEGVGGLQIEERSQLGEL